MLLIPENKIREIDQIVEWYRSIILDSVEEAFGSSKDWDLVRGKLLRALGDRGLHGKIRQALCTPQ